MKKIILSTIFIFGILFSFSLADGGSDGGDDYLLVPEGESSAAGEVGQKPGELWNEYNDKANTLSTGDQIASGIMNWDTVLALLKHIVNFVSNIALVVGALTIIYAGYMYATQIFGGQASKGKDAIMKSLQGILVVVFAFAILKILVNMFIGS